jgi:uncharacterized protein
MVMASALPPHFGASLKLGLVALTALCLGSLTGHLLGLHRLLGRAVVWAGNRDSGPAGFPLEVVVLVANPLGIVGAVLEGWTGDWRPLGLKASLDTLAALGFSAAGSRTVWLAALPMWAVQGTLTLGAALLVQRFPDPAPAAALRLCAGLMVVAATPVILGLRKVPLANYLPSLVYGPLLAAWWC